MTKGPWPLRLLLCVALILAGVAIWRLVTDGDDSVAGLDPVAGRIGRYRRRGDLDALAREAAGGDAAVAVQAVEALGYAGPGSVPYLERAMKDPRPEVREAAAIALGRAADRDRTGALVRAVSADRSPNVRAAAATALGVMYAYNEMPKLLKALDDPDRMVRRRAAAATRRITGIDFGYRADAPREQRRRIVARMRALWPRMEQNLRDYYAARGNKAKR